MNGETEDADRTKESFALFSLEFFGDALLDFLIIRHAFLNYERDVTPGLNSFCQK